jgi:hypothetical protein
VVGVGAAVTGAVLVVALTEVDVEARTGFVPLLCAAGVVQPAANTARLATTVSRGLTLLFFRIPDSFTSHRQRA